MYMIGSFDFLNSDCRSFSDLKTVTDSRPKNFQVSQIMVSLSEPSVNHELIKYAELQCASYCHF